MTCLIRFYSISVQAYLNIFGIHIQCFPEVDRLGLVDAPRTFHRHKLDLPHSSMSSTMLSHLENSRANMFRLCVERERESDGDGSESGRVSDQSRGV